MCRQTDRVKTSPLLLLLLQASACVCAPADVCLSFMHAMALLCCFIPAGAHSCFSSLTVTGPIATTAADLLLVYAALANIDYPQKGPSTPASRCGTQVSSSRKPKKGADAAVAAAAALAAPPLQPLELPRQLLPGLSYVQEQQLQQQAVNSSLPAGWKPLAGMSFGICRQWYMLCEPGVLAAVDKAAEGLFKLGAALVDLQIPELDLLQVCGCLCWLDSADVLAAANPVPGFQAQQLWSSSPTAAGSHAAAVHMLTNSCNCSLTFLGDHVLCCAAAGCRLPTQPCLLQSVILMRGRLAGGRTSCCANRYAAQAQG